MTFVHPKILRTPTFLALALSFYSIAFVYAENADQDKPIILEAEKVSVNDVQQVYELNGDVLLTKGSILVTGEKGSLKRLLNMQMIDQLRGWKIEYDDIKQTYRVFPPSNAKPEDLPLARAILSPRRKATLEK